MNQKEIIATDLESHAGFTFVGDEEGLEEAVKNQKIRKLRDTIKGSFNKEVLYKTKFSHTEHFSEAANHKRKFGVYTYASFGTKAYREYWLEQGRRCLEGFQNPVTGVWITGYHYFFLNFKQLKL